MAAATTSAPVLIIYDKLNTTQENGSVVVQLQRYLSAKGMEYTLKDYADTFDPSALPQYLILVYSSQSQKPPQLDKAVDRMLDLVVQRRMRSIVAITTAPPSGFSPVTVSLPPKWASIPTYNASSYSDKNQLAEDVLREAQSAKLPYSQAQAQQSLTQRAQSFAGAKLRNVPASLPSVLIVLVCVLIVGAVGMGAFIYLRPAQTTSQPSTKPTVVARATTISTTKTGATASLQPTSTPDPNLKDRQQALNDDTKGAPTISGFQKGDAWSILATETTSCAYDGTNYTVSVKQNTQQYAPCLATGLLYKNFVMQVTMDIQGDAGGVILRSNSNANTYYRLAVSQIYTGGTDMPTFTLVLCDKGACSTNSTSVGVQVDSVSAKVDKHPVTLTVIARDKNIDVYANKKFVTRFTDTTDTAAGQVGMYAADLNHGATVKFSDLKIWSLDNK